MNLDRKDCQVLHAIATEKTHSPDKIEEVTGIPKSTVHYRIQQLKDKGVISDDLMNVNLEAVGLPITLISQVWADYDEDFHNKVGKKLRNIEGVNQVYFLLGDTDFMVISHLPSRKKIEELVEQFESIDEITRTSSKFVITTIKHEPHPIGDYREETLFDILLE